MPGRRSRLLLAAVVAILVTAVVVVRAEPRGGGRLEPNPGRASFDPSPGLPSPALVASPPMTPQPAPAELFVPEPNPGATAQLADLRRAGRTVDANLIQHLIETPAATWFGGGSPDEVEARVRALVTQSADRLPALVAYNVPGRDCAQYSAGGAATGEAYRAWIEAFSAGISDHRAIVILEPDGLALQPGDCGQPDTFDRSSLIGAAVDILRSANPRTAVYLDAGHSAWHDVDEMSRRLVRAGVARATGFFLNASNYQATRELITYGTSIARCVRRIEQGSACTDTPDASQAADRDLPHFVIDTSRNGQGPWTTNTPYPDKQDWCNPPDRGLGPRPTLDPGNPLVDAYLWIKIPGESDGSCARGAAAGSVDPEWGVVDPAAGQWFPEQALQLARLANPPLEP